MLGITGYKTFLEDGTTANALQISTTLIHSYEVRGMIMHVSCSQTEHEGAKYQFYRATAANEYKILQKFRIRHCISTNLPTEGTDFP
jgi:hypothetical protein